jgi:anti-sigma-K factor RskA
MSHLEPLLLAPCCCYCHPCFNILNEPRININVEKKRKRKRKTYQQLETCHVSGSSPCCWHPAAAAVAAATAAVAVAVSTATAATPLLLLLLPSLFQYAE